MALAIASNCSTLTRQCPSVLCRCATEELLSKCREVLHFALLFPLFFSLLFLPSFSHTHYKCQEIQSPSRFAATWSRPTCDICTETNTLLCTVTGLKSLQFSRNIEKNGFQARLAHAQMPHHTNCL